MTDAPTLKVMRGWGDADERLTAIKDAYLRMEALYRPEAPSDGFGNIQLTQAEAADPLRLEMEGWTAAGKWHEEDERGEFVVIGCADYRNAAAMYLILQAAQLCCSGVHPSIRGILELAIQSLPKGDGRG